MALDWTKVTSFKELKKFMVTEDRDTVVAFKPEGRGRQASWAEVGGVCLAYIAAGNDWPPKASFYPVLKAGAGFSSPEILTEASLKKNPLVVAVPSRAQRRVIEKGLNGGKLVTSFSRTILDAAAEEKKKAPARPAHTFAVGRLARHAR